MPKTYADGKTLIDRDLTHIADARSRLLDRAIRITQHAPEDSNDVTWLTARIQTYGDEWEADMPSSEVMIDLYATEENASRVRELIRSWMSPSTTNDDMQALIDDLWRP